MLSYFLNCKKNSENVGKKVLKTKNTRTMLSSKCIVDGSKKSRFIREE